MSEDIQAPGWEAIDKALAPRYAGQEPKHYGTLIRGATAMDALDRASLLENKDVREKLARGAAAEGSNTGSVYVDQLNWSEKKRMLRKPEPHIYLGARQVKEILGLLPYRLPFGKEFALVCSEFKVIFEPASDNGYSMEGSTLRIAVQPDVVSEIQSVLKQREGIYGLRAFDGVVLYVKKTHIKDDSGNVVETIG